MYFCAVVIMNLYPGVNFEYQNMCVNMGVNIGANIHINTVRFINTSQLKPDV